jgi:hypothetical protein
MGDPHNWDAIEPDCTLVRRYMDGLTNVAALGVYTEAGAQQVIEAFAYYHRYLNPRSRLLFHGRAQAAPWLVPLDSLESVEWKTYLLVSHALLWTETNEVQTDTLLAALRQQVPVVAWKDPLAQPVLGGQGLYWEEWSPGLIAQSLTECIEKPAVGEFLVRNQREAVTAYGLRVGS